MRSETDIRDRCNSILELERVLSLTDDRTQLELPQPPPVSEWPQLCGHLFGATAKATLDTLIAQRQMDECERELIHHVEVWQMSPNSKVYQYAAIDAQGNEFGRSTFETRK
jgi:hypothetical protein